MVVKFYTIFALRSCTFGEWESRCSSIILMMVSVSVQMKAKTTNQKQPSISYYFIIIIIFFWVESGRFYLKETEFIQHQNLHLGHKVEVPLCQISP